MKKRKYTQLTDNERDRIGILLKQGYMACEIADALGRHPSTVGREIARNRRKTRTVVGTFNGPYQSSVACHKAYVRKKYKKKDWKKIEKNPTLKQYIIRGLKKHWNPDEIAGRMKKDNLPFYASKTAIYEWLRSARGERYCQYLYSKRRYVKKHTKKTKRALIPNRVSITERSLGATNRSRYGHWETDTVVSGKRGTGALSVSVDRKSRYVLIDKLHTLKPSEHINILARRFSAVTTKSVTFDNGVENRDHQKLPVPTFFCDTYASWQKGSVEHANKMIRRYVPKGSNITRIDDTFIENIVMILNNKPRKSLNYKTPREVMLNNGLLKTTETIALAP